MDERLHERWLDGDNAVALSPPFVPPCLRANVPPSSPFVAPSLRRSLAPLRAFVPEPVPIRSGCVRAFLLLTLLTLPGCALFGRREGFTPDRAMLASLAYPSDAERGGDLDIVVVRRSGAVEVNNLTARTYREMLLWLNEMYVSKVDQIQIGTKNRFELDWFVNRHGESYPKGGLLKPDKSFPVVSAELFDPATGRRHRLVVRMKPS